ncbi:hypothetical protein VR010_11700 [Actinomycetaceae bacterium L2_0104]
MIRSSRPLAVIAALGLALGLSACGGDSEEASAESPSSENPSESPSSENPDNQASASPENEEAMGSAGENEDSSEDSDCDDVKSGCYYLAHVDPDDADIYMYQYEDKADSFCVSALGGIKNFAERFGLDESLVEADDWQASFEHTGDFQQITITCTLPVGEIEHEVTFVEPEPDPRSQDFAVYDDASKTHIFFMTMSHGASIGNTEKIDGAAVQAFLGEEVMPKVNNTK